MQEDTFSTTFKMRGTNAETTRALTIPHEKTSETYFLLEQLRPAIIRNIEVEKQ